MEDNLKRLVSEVTRLSREAGVEVRGSNMLDSQLSCMRHGKPWTLLSDRPQRHSLRRLPPRGPEVLGRCDCRGLHIIRRLWPCPHRISGPAPLPSASPERCAIPGHCKDAGVAYRHTCTHALLYCILHARLPYSTGTYMVVLQTFTRAGCHFIDCILQVMMEVAFKRQRGTVEQEHAEHQEQAGMLARCKSRSSRTLPCPSSH